VKFYIVSDRYISYLKTIDGKVPDNYNGSRPFIGVVIEVNGVSYIAPLSSPKPQLERINNSKPTAFKIYNRKDGTEFLGVINLNYMIPVLDNEVTLLDVDNVDVKYKNLLKKQHEYIKIHQADIEARAIKLHDLVRTKKQAHFVDVSCCFDDLEANFKSFTP